MDQVEDITNSVDKIKFDNVESKGITKSEIKNIQNDLQSGNKKGDILNFKKDVNTISISKQIGKQAMVNGTMGLGIGMAANIGTKIIQGKEVEVEEVIETGIKTGGSVGLSTAVAGGIKVAVEKEIIPAMSNNTIGAIAASSMDIIGTACKLGSGEISLGEAVKEVGTSISSAYSAIVSSSFGYTATIAAVGMVGLGTLGTVGSKIGGEIANGVGTIAEKVVDKAVEVVKEGIDKVKNIANGVVNKVQSIGKKISSGLSKVASWFGF